MDVDSVVSVPNTRANLTDEAKQVGSAKNISQKYSLPFPEVDPLYGDMSDKLKFPRLQYGKFLISKLKKTQGLTVANTLRRILLYQVPALSITEIKFERGMSINGQNFSGNIEAANSSLMDSATSAKGKTKVKGRSPKGEAPSTDPELVPLAPIHEFSRIPGLYESLLELTMNLEAVVFKSTNEEVASTYVSGVDSETVNSYGISDCPSMDIQRRNTCTLRLPLLSSMTLPSGTAELLATNKPLVFSRRNILQAKDLILPTGVSVVYPEQYLATIMEVSNSDSPLCGDAISKGNPGKGAKPSDQVVVTCVLEKLSDTLPPRLQAAKPTNKRRTPIKKVNYTIENFEQGEEVVFEIWTNGAISPQDAFTYGIHSAVNLFQQFLSLS